MKHYILNLALIIIGLFVISCNNNNNKVTPEEKAFATEFDRQQKAIDSFSNYFNLKGGSQWLWNKIRMSNRYRESLDDNSPIKYGPKYMELAPYNIDPQTRTVSYGVRGISLNDIHFEYTFVLCKEGNYYSIVSADAPSSFYNNTTIGYRMSED